MRRITYVEVSKTSAVGVEGGIVELDELAYEERKSEILLLDAPGALHPVTHTRHTLSASNRHRNSLPIVSKSAPVSSVYYIRGSAGSPIPAIFAIEAAYAGVLKYEVKREKEGGSDGVKGVLSWVLLGCAGLLQTWFLCRSWWGRHRTGLLRLFGGFTVFPRRSFST